MPQSKQTNLSSVVKSLPTKPGVYRFYSDDIGLLYIGKAKNLKNRVSSYFQQGRPRNERLSLMISQIDKIEYTVVATEKESLILEANLIHQLQPKYNILLKDDKSYLYVRFTYADRIPGIFLVRRKYDHRSKYFGPYTKRYGIEQTLRTLRTIFPYCQQKTEQKRPCEYYGIKQCEGICITQEDPDSYKQKLLQIENVLRGKIDLVEDYITQKIQAAAQTEDYKLAALWRDRLQLLKETITDQKIILPQPQDLDIVTLVISCSDSGLYLGSVFVQNIRGGRVINLNNFLLSGTEDDPEEAINLSISDSPEEHLQNLGASFLQRFFSNYYSKSSESVEVLTQVYTPQVMDMTTNIDSFIKRFKASDKKPQLIFLTGFRASGKTTLGKNLSRAINYKFVDMDDLIFQKSKQTVSQLTKNGKDWSKFRKLELEILQELSKSKKTVISCGGGVGVNNHNGSEEAKFLKTLPKSLVLWLKPKDEIIKQRLEKDYSDNPDSRPTLAGGQKASIVDLIKENLEIYQERKPSYRSLADQIILDS